MAKTYKKKDGSSIVKAANGKIVGNLPSDASKPVAAPVLPQKAGSVATESAQPSLYEIRQAEYAKKEQDRVVTREVAANLADEIEERFPTARLLGLNDELEPVSLEDWEGNVVEILTPEKYPELFDTFSQKKENIAGGLENGWQQKERTPQAPGATKFMFLSFRCKASEDCQFRHTGYGWAPSHEASRFCSSGRRAHCTCDTCF